MCITCIHLIVLQKGKLISIYFVYYLFKYKRRKVSRGIFVQVVICGHFEAAEGQGAVLFLIKYFSEMKQFKQSPLIGAPPVKQTIFP